MLISFLFCIRYLRNENLNLFYTSKTLELKKKHVIQKDIENPHNLRGKNVWRSDENDEQKTYHYPVNIFLLLTHISLQLFLLSSSLLFLSVKRGFKFICNGWFQFSKYTSAFLIFKTPNVGNLSDWMDLYFESTLFRLSGLSWFVCLRRDTFRRK